jgi:hypothetical protein
MERKRRTSSWGLSETDGHRLESPSGQAASREKRRRKGSRSRLETPLTVVVVVAQGKAKYFWLDIHAQYRTCLSLIKLRCDAGSDRSRQTDAIRFLQNLILHKRWNIEKGYPL